MVQKVQDRISEEIASAYRKSKTENQKEAPMSEKKRDADTAQR